MKYLAIFHIMGNCRMLRTNSILCLNSSVRPYSAYHQIFRQFSWSSKRSKEIRKSVLLAFITLEIKSQLCIHFQMFLFICSVNSMFKAKILVLGVQLTRLTVVCSQFSFFYQLVTYLAVLKQDHTFLVASNLSWSFLSKFSSKNTFNLD